MPFKDLEKITENVKTDVEPDVDHTKNVTDPSNLATLKKTTQEAVSKDQNDDLFDNVPI